MAKKGFINSWRYHFVYKSYYLLIFTYEEGQVLKMKFWQGIMKQTRDKIPNQDTVQNLKVQLNYYVTSIRLVTIYNQLHILLCNYLLWPT
jgi:hypothetical protein